MNSDIFPTNSTVLIDESILRVGEVLSVDGRVVRILVDKSKNVSHLNFRGKVLRNVSVGGYIKISKGFETIICKIEGEFTEEVKFNMYKEYKDSKEQIRRVLKVGMVGFYATGLFRKGIKEMPLVGNSCYLLNDNEINEIHAFVSRGESPIIVGSLASDTSMSIRVGVDSLFASHIGIFGNTGSGKSYTLAKIYHSLFNLYKNNQKFQKNARFFLVDFNGEYAQSDFNDFIDEDQTIVEEKYKIIYKLSTRHKNSVKFPMSYSILNDSTIWTILLEATDKTQVPFIRRSLDSKYITSVLEDEVSLKKFVVKFIIEVTTFKDKNLDKGVVVNFLRELESSFEGNPELSTVIDYFDEHLEYFAGNNTYYLNEDKRIYADNDSYKSRIQEIFEEVEFDIEETDEIKKIRLKLILNYYSEISRGFSNKEHLAPLIKRLSKRFEDIEKVITCSDEKPERNKNLFVVSLKDVNIHMRKVLPLLFAKHLYEDQKKRSNGQNYLNIIIDEAHNVLSPISNRESEQWKDYRLETFEEIIKEGRKFGVFLTIASQRPSDISATIISQLHNYFIHRLINNKDIDSIERNLSYMDKVSVDSLPILSTGVCVLAGIAAQMPVIIEIGKIPAGYTPHSETIRPSVYWK